LPRDPRAEALRRALTHSYLEIFPSDRIAEALAPLPAGSYVAITCSPRRGIETTLALAEQLARRHLRLVPHVSARLVLDELHLRDIMQRLSELGVDSIFVPAGDVAVPAGKFSSSLEVLRAMAEIDHTVTEIGIAAYPEGHPLIDARSLAAALEAKARYATYLVTQMCFDAGTIVSWLAAVRARGVRLPAWIGLPGVGDRSKLLATSLRIGVGESVRFLKSRRALVGRLLKGYRPDALLDGLADAVADPERDIPGFHLYSFNRVASTEAWRAERLAALRTRRSVRALL
jgi:methylenetetrahydrofolate reductase (NADPH)